MEDISTRTVRRLGHGILTSPGMKRERGFIQHGDVSVLEHSFMVAVLCGAIARRLPGKWDFSSLVRGALLHDYFLYDWSRTPPGLPTPPIMRRRPCGTPGGIFP